MVTGCRDNLQFGFRGSPELGSVTKREHEALLSRFARFDISLMDEDHRYRDQSFATKIAGSSNSKGATIVVERHSVEC